MHTLEGAVRSAARRKGRYVGGALEHSTADVPTYTLSCVLGSRRCPFLVKLRLLDRKEGEEQRFRCIEIHQRHTCLTEAKVPNKHLESRIKFFVRSSLPLILSDESD
jgi:hypothetical protein